MAARAAIHRNARQARSAPETDQKPNHSASTPITQGRASGRNSHATAGSAARKDAARRHAAFFTVLLYAGPSEMPPKEFAQDGGIEVQLCPARLENEDSHCDQHPTMAITFE